MNVIYVLIATAVLIYLCRFSGFTLTWLAASTRLARFLHFVPIAIFSALIVPSISSEPAFLGRKVIALIAAGVVIRRTRHFGLGIIVGLGLFWLLAN
jgi:branched-subunit amino acid transport protein